MKLERSFYERNTLIVARKLLGCVLVHITPEGITKGRIVETEAYMGPEDKGAHSYGGRHTPRMNPLYKTGGFAYIYQLHGYNYCINVVTQKEGVPQAVLIRGLEPVKGLELMAKRRKIDISDNRKSKLKNLTNGPSKLCQAMKINTSLNGIDLCGDEIFITNQTDLRSNEEIIAAPRVNIDYAEEYRDKLWRFLIKGNAFISKGYKGRNFKKM
ncbi:MULTISPECIES: DNA-3-methyladenine glycosylase [Methanobacterium]|jgi:DNA-3-methyladenine glycosylase|uniref:Putative 3-methyladenine DNA glycosylase n=1 Tax=Methanobacterium veterum TaxID=408577 RepID=A0A9E5DLN9_9EURY|nr:MULTISPECIES: DNA-3-methyladenine glycosylase [Methanobacterium]MCZ3365593.1 DNA-3-methyladenine glycosylase [Methanobacterium veterum]MCZ3371056.1 DNA-3-methyladenine glycosylase [Methanobacterium veterum]